MLASSQSATETSLVLLSQSVALVPLQKKLTREFPSLSLHYFSDLRKTLNFIKKNRPIIVIAEFIYAPTYGSQLSNYEALCATIQRHSVGSKFIALVSASDQHHLDRLNDNVRIDWQLTLPLDLTLLSQAIAAIILNL